MLHELALMWLVLTASLVCILLLVMGVQRLRR